MIELIWFGLGLLCGGIAAVVFVAIVASGGD